MRVKIVTLIMWIILLTLIINPYTINITAEQKLMLEDAADREQLIITSGVPTLNAKQLIIPDTNILIPSGLNQYTAGVDCTEELSFSFLAVPGATVTVLDGPTTELNNESAPAANGNVPDRTKINLANVVKAGQGFDAKVVVRAKFSAGSPAACKTAANYSIFYNKLVTGNSVTDSALKLYLTPSELSTASFTSTTENTIEYDMKNGVLTGNAINMASATPIEITFYIYAAYFDKESGATIYRKNAPNGSNWQPMIKNKGFYYTNVSSCPKKIVKTGDPETQYYVVEYVYDSSNGANTEVGSNIRYGMGVGSYHLAQELMVASNKYACNSVEEVTRMRLLSNNFHFTQINMEDPFNANKYKDANSIVDLLNWTGYWNVSNPNAKAQWTALSNPLYQPIVLDFTSDAGKDKLRSLKELYKNSPKINDIDSYSVEFKSVVSGLPHYP